MLEDVREFYMSKGFGGRVGFGERPAIIVIDMAKSWLDESSPLGSRAVSGVMGPILRILEAGRAAAVPIFFTTMVFDPHGVEASGPIGRKLLHTSDQRALEKGTSLVELDPRLARRPDEILVEKQRASAFWGTPFLAHLVGRKVDTLIITGCSTSGCVRGTAESAHNYNLHTIVVAEAVGDRSPKAHEYNLTDIDMRYADVVSLDATLGYLAARKAR
jgi:nicotinamidase-related amidase